LAPEHSLQARSAPGSITVDGNLGEWANLPFFPFDASAAQYVGGAIAGPSDTSSALSIAWDGSHLYVAAVMTDDILIADSASIWDDDSLEVAIDGARDGRCCGPDDHQFTIALDGRFADFGAVIAASSSAVRFAAAVQGSSYRIEMAIPMISLTSLPVVSGTVMGINLGLNDDDDGGRRDKRLVWVGNSTLDFANLGSLVFVTAGPAVPTGTPTATRTRTATTPPGSTATATTTAPPSATPTTTGTPSSTRTAAPATPSATSTAAISVTPSPTAQATRSAGERLADLESSIVTLEGRIRTILDILQRAGRFPESRGVATPAGTPRPGRAVGDPAAYFQAVNCGGPAYTAQNGDLYSADQIYTAGSWGYLSGQTAAVGNAIANTNDDPLYQTERYNLTGYSFDVPAGSYQVVLRFAETYQYAVNRGRIFDVKIENEIAVKDLDILARAGPFAALDLTFSGVVSDGQLNITFVASAGVAKINAIVVRGAGPPGPTPTPSLDDRTSAVSARLTELETIVSAILAIFQTTIQTPTATVTATPTAAPTVTSPPGTPTRTFTPAPTRTPTVTRTRTATPGGPTPTAHVARKKGVAGGENPEAMRELGITWSYIWYPAPNNFNTVYEHVPMIWGRDYNPTTVTQIAASHPGSYWLIWNEPDYWQQANIQPGQAAQLYRSLRSLIKTTDPAAKLIVGGVYNLNTAWLTSFRQEYFRLYNEWPAVEGWHVHHYVGRAEYSSAVWRERLQAVRDWMAANGGAVELWLTEFGCLNSEDVAMQIMADQTPWLDAQPWLTRYSWYAAFASGPGCPDCSGSLFYPDYTLTDTGQLYRQVP
jgi:hypothetical protein